MTGCSSWRAAAQQWLAGTTLGQELSGSLGDLGTFLPLVVSLLWGGCVGCDIWCDIL
jgi:hypothetical protein